MENYAKRIIHYAYYTLVFLVPLAFFPKTSELFEFNKIILTYALSVIILLGWLLRMIAGKRVIFQKTLLDIPLIIFLAASAISTYFSIDKHTSIFGYYSRFNGGLLSTTSYCLLYWGLVSNLRLKEAKRILYITLFSAVFVSIWGILQHFGVDKKYWVQDVQNRVFSTLGQPNWLAAWLVSIIPLTWAFTLRLKLKQFSKINFKAYMPCLLISVLFFITLLFTKSRSGLLGFLFTSLIFWSLIFWISFKKLKSTNLFRLKSYFFLFSIFNLSFLIFTITIGTPWTPSLSQIVKSNSSAITYHQPPITNAPALEVGGTESGEIRKIVWRGALEIWKHFPILGSGPETFAYSYYSFRPVEHNLVSEWDFIYNKAHNEYLNFLATTGSLGFSAYAILIIAILFMFIDKMKIKTPNTEKPNVIIIALFSGFISLLITNFFGFSVVTTSLSFYLFPAIAFALELDSGRTGELNKTRRYTLAQKTCVSLLGFLAILIFYSIARYWYGDFLYAKGKLLNNQKQYSQARDNLLKATELSKKEAVYYNELSQSSVGLAQNSFEQQDEDATVSFSQSAIDEANYAIELSPYNLNHRRNLASIYLRLSQLDPKVLSSAANAISDAIKLAPTDAKLYYNLGLVLLRLKEEEAAENILKDAVELKPDYRDARFALSLIYINRNEKIKAKNELNYIIEKINPNDDLVKSQLEELK